MSTEELPRKEKDLLTSGSGQSFFGAKAYLSTPNNRIDKPERSRTTTPNRLKGKSPRRKPPPRSKSTRAATPKKDRETNDTSSSLKDESQQQKERNLSLPVTQNDFNNDFIPNAEHSDMYHNRKVVSRMEGNGVDVYQVIDLFIL